MLILYGDLKMRLGKYSGRIYKENEVKTMQECGICITEDQSKDEEYILKHHVNDLMDCIICCGCPYAIQNHSS